MGMRDRRRGSGRWQIGVMMGHCLAGRRLRTGTGGVSGGAGWLRALAPQEDSLTLRSGKCVATPRPGG